MMNSRHRFPVRRRLQHFRRTHNGNWTLIQIVNVRPSNHETEQEHDPKNTRTENLSRVEKKKLNVFKDFSTNTSLHGIKYAADDERSWIERIWWSVMVIGSFCLCFYLVAQVWDKRVNNPIIVTFDEKLTPIEQVPFPAVTVCPLDQANTTMFNFSKLCETKEFNSTVEEDFYNFYSVICQDKCELPGHVEDRFADEHVLSEIKKILLPAHVSMMKCVIYGYEIVCNNSFKDLITPHGRCFTYNFLSGKDIYSIGSYIEYFEDHTEHLNGWSIDHGYSEQIDTIVEKIYPKQARPSSRPVMELTLKSPRIFRDFRCNAMQEGFLIAIHPPNVVPRRGDFMQATYGSISKFYVKPAVMITEESLKNYEPEKRQCYFSDERRLRFYQNYTREYCESECISNYTLPMCGCVQLGMPRNDSMPICSGGSHFAANFLLNGMSLQGFVDKSPQELIKDKVSEHQAYYACNCLQSCTTLNYKTTSLTNKMDMKKFDKLITEHDLKKGDTKKEFDLMPGDTIAKVEIYITDSYFIKSKRSELYSVTDFLANCGGLIGVCLGFSILSLVEIFYFFTIRIFCDMRKRRNRVASEN